MRNLNIQSKDLSKVEDITFFFLRKDMLLDQFGIKVRLHKTNDNYTLRVYMGSETIVKKFEEQEYLYKVMTLFLNSIYQMEAIKAEQKQ